MLPGLRFLFAATLMCTSLLVFGMGAIALLRASHQQFASLPPRQPPEPVFAQAPETIPSLSMLRADPPPPPAATSPAERTAALSTAERGTEPVPAASPPVVTDSVLPEPKASEPASESYSDAGPATDPAQITPRIQTPPAADSVSVAEAPVTAEKAPEPAQPETTPAAPSPQVASAPDLSPKPEITGSTPPAEPPVPATPMADPPLPHPRPSLAALPADADPSVAKAAKPAVRRKLSHAKPPTAPKSEKLPAVTSAPTLGSLFSGGGSGN